jgi:hypothetical protein
MTKTTTSPCLPQAGIECNVHLFDNWFDPIESGLRTRVRDFLQAMLEAELDEALGRSRYVRRPTSPRADSEAAPALTGHRHGHRFRSLLGTFGKVEISVPRARLSTADGGTREWKSRVLRAYQRCTLAADALIASCYLAGTNTRRVRHALASLFAGAVSKDTLTARRSCSRSRPWVARAPRPGERCSTISSAVGCGGPRSSSSMAQQGLRTPSLRSGTACRCSVAPSTSIATCWRTRPSGCMRRSPPTTTT